MSKKKRAEGFMGIQPPVFTDEHTKELAALLGVKGADKTAALYNELDTIASAVRFVSKGYHDAAQKKAKKLAGLLDKMDANGPSPQERLFFHYNHPGMTEGWEADMDALARLKKTFTATAKSITGRKQSFPAFHQAARDLIELYEKYSGKDYKYAGVRTSSGRFTETNSGEIFVGRAMKILFPKITSSQKATALRDK